MDSYTPMKEPKYCFVPACNSRDTQKIFFVVPSSAKQEWCNVVGISCPRRVIYICEDHLNNEDPLQSDDGNEITVFCPKCNAEISHTAEGIQEDQTKIIIANVYHYFEQEYEELKKSFDSLELTPLSKFRQRTALATGVSETTVLEILKEEARRNAEAREEPSPNESRAQKRPKQTDSSSEEDSDSNADGDDELSSAAHQVETLVVKEEPAEEPPEGVNDEPEIYMELPGVSGTNDSLADPISLELKTEPQNEEASSSTDSDSIERPKSAMQKEAHPEYDPHEPMITSAFSEEDLRKSREDVFEENYRNDMSTFEADYDPSKSLVEPNILPEGRFPAKQDKTSEVESDQEPSSTVDHSAATVWSGCINMVDMARFYVAAHEVSGSSVDLEEDLSTELDIVGRINPDAVWDYIAKMKKTSNKDIVILKLQTANDEEKMQYIALYSYLSSRNRLGVVKASNMMTVKDFYIVPLPANTTLPAVLLPLDGPGIGEIKTHLLIAIVIRQRKKRLAANILTDVIPAKVARESRKRSYTPPASPRRRPQLPRGLLTHHQLSLLLVCG